MNKHLSVPVAPRISLPPSRYQAKAHLLRAPICIASRKARRTERRLQIFLCSDQTTRHQLRRQPTVIHATCTLYRYPGIINTIHAVVMGKSKYLLYTYNAQFNMAISPLPISNKRFFIF